MLQNYLKIAWRKIWTQRFYAGINILGLAIGIACCLLISLFVLDELNYDSFNEKADRIYRITMDLKMNGQVQEFAVVTSRLKDAVVSEIPEIETAGRFRSTGQWLVRKEGVVQNLRETKAIYADAEVFDIFTIPLLQGDPNQILQEPNTLVLSQSAAERYFGTANAVGEILILDNEESYRVDGVYEDLPSNSHFHYDFFLSMEGLEEVKNDIWLDNNFFTYFLLKPNAATDNIAAKINEIFRNNARAQMNEFSGSDNAFEEFESAGNSVTYDIQFLKSIHLDSNLIPEHEPNGSRAFVWIFSAIALFILMIACINFMNLSTARSANRAKEVGMRKVLGSQRSNLIGQFLAESTLMSAIAFIFAIGICLLVMPAFNDLTDKTLSIPFIHPLFIAAVLTGIAGVGLLAGSYPAFFLSAFDPLKTIKGKLQQGSKSGRLRQILVTSQFSISIILMIGTGVIYNQLKYIQNQRLGFDKEQVLILNTFGYSNSFESLKNQIEVLPEVNSTTASCFLPAFGKFCRNNVEFWETGKNPNTDSQTIQWWSGDYDYLQTLGIELKTGRFFEEQFSTDTTAVVLNEAAVRAFSLENPIGSRLQNDPNMKPLTVIGVIKNFNFNSLRDEITPLVMTLNTESDSRLAIRVEAGTNMGNFISKIENIWQQNAPSEPIDYTFLDESINQVYESEQRLGTIFLLFAGLAIFIACLGLFALVAFTAERRKKEISIRKTLGASVSNLVSLLSKEFLILVIVALIISIPIAYYAMYQWLQSFAYRIKLQWWVFALAGVVAIGIALLTVSFQSVKAALANPVKSLRSE
ncbi:MAG: ABC transporter permease [Bacteroidota bacterium]